MGVKAKGLAAVLLLWCGTVAASDLRLVEAAKNHDAKTVRTLLAEHASVNTPEADGATALAWAAHWGDLETAERLIHAGAKVNRPNQYDATPLWLACDNSNAAMVELLLKAGADPNIALPSGETPLMTSARTGNVEIVRALLARRARVDAAEQRRGQTALMWAVAEEHPDVTQVLLAHGADVHTRSKGGFTPLLFAAQSGDLESARMLLAAGADVNKSTPEDGSALVVASASGHEALAIFLLDKGADPNAADGNGITSLHYAMLKGLATLDTVRYQEKRGEPITAYFYRPNLPGLVKALLEHGANPNVRVAKDPLWPVSQREVTSPAGATPFLLAATTYDVDLMRLLVAHGADPHIATKENTTALIMASGIGDRLCELPPFRAGHRTAEEEKKALEAVKLLVELGVDVNAANKTGITALHGAALMGADDVISYLVTKGANVNATDIGGQTPYTIAAAIIPPTLRISDSRPFVAHKSTAELLLKLGATPPPSSPVARVSHN